VTSVSDTVLASFVVASEPGNERDAQRRVVQAVLECGLSPDQLDRLETAVAEATMNAIEHGNHNRPDIPVEVTVHKTATDVVVTITDQAGGGAAASQAEIPDLEKKLTGEQSPRGWGLFLIRHMVDDFETTTDGARHTVRLSMRLGGRGGSHD
jgi:anti-sigma regulatory factor (Ser/Thr protein kinase)